MIDMKPSLSIIQIIMIFHTTNLHFMMFRGSPLISQGAPGLDRADGTSDFSVAHTSGSGCDAASVRVIKRPWFIMWFIMIHGG